MRIRRTASITLGSALLAIGALAVSLTTAPARAYPPDQLARGEQVWRSVCADCHGPTSIDPDAPLLLIPGSLKGYPHAAAAFQYSRDSMPNDMPGSLPEQDYWDVLAFILQQQGIDRDVELGPATAVDIPTTP